MIAMKTAPHAPAPIDAARSTSRSGRTSFTPVVLAQTVAHAASTVPGVADVRSSRADLVATYGPHTRVSGVTFTHPAPGKLAVEVHIIVSHAAISVISVADAASGRNATALRAQSMPVLLRIASQVRGAVYSTLRGYGARLSAVDVSIDDLQ